MTRDQLHDLTAAIQHELELARAGEGYEEAAVAEEIVERIVAPMLVTDMADRVELSHWRSGHRRKTLPVIESVPDGIHYAAALVRAQGTEGGDDHDRLLREAAVRLERLDRVARRLLADRARVEASRQDWVAECARLEMVEDVRHCTLQESCPAEVHHQGCDYRRRGEFCCDQPDPIGDGDQEANSITCGNCGDDMDGDMLSRLSAAGGVS